MDLLQKMKQELLFIYYANIQNKKKLVFIVSSVILLTLSIGAAVYSLKTKDAFTTFTDAKTTLSKEQLLASDKALSTGNEEIEKAFLPTPTVIVNTAETEFVAILQNALEATWKRINLLPNSSSKITLNNKAAEIELLLNEKKTNEAQTLLASLIHEIDEVEQSIILSLTPSPSPTPSPTITPTPTPLYTPDGTSYSAKTISTDRGAFSVKVITIDTDKYNMVTDTADNSDCSNNCTTKSLSAYIKENDAVAGINGTYFCPPDYAECTSKKNSFDFPVYNSRLKKWINVQNISWRNRAMLYKNTNGYVFKSDTSSAWRLKYPDKYPDYALEAAITNAPGLLENGNVIANNYPLTDKQKAKSAKVGIGFNGNTVFLLIAYNVTMEEFGYVFKGLGATDALNLDSGGSAAMWYGNYKAGPGRSLPNAIVFVRK